MTVKELINALLSTGLSPNSTVCLYTQVNQRFPFHISSVEEDSGNTGIVVIRHRFQELREDEVGYR